MNDGMNIINSISGQSQSRTLCWLIGLVMLREVAELV